MKKQQSADAGAPAWMVTMGDMNTLLLTFFVLLVSLMTLEVGPRSQKDIDIEESDPLSRPQQAKGPSPTETEIKGGLTQGDNDKSHEKDLEQFQTMERITKNEDNYIITLGAKTEEFDIGSWQLSDSHKDILNKIHKTLLSQTKKITLKGYTDTNFIDALQVTKGTDGSFTMSPMTVEQTKIWESRSSANHWLLSYLRAKTVEEYLVEKGISKDVFIVEPMAYTTPLASEKDEIKRRVVQIIVSTVTK